MSRDDKSKLFIPSKIVSGGQTGVDRAGLDAAMSLKVKTGGYMPKGALAEDGKVPCKYRLKETKTADYAERTILNILISGATLIVNKGELEGGTLLTYQICLKKKKPVLILDITPPLNKLKTELAVFLNRYKPQTLNIAGPRESKYPGIYKAAFKFLMDVFVS
jgi:hypothetical protein